MRNQASIAILLAGIGGIHAAGASTVATVTIDVYTEIDSLQLTGTAYAPLARDPGNVFGDSIDGYGFLNTDVLVTESATQQSLGTTQVTIDYTDFEHIMVSMSSSFSLYLDLQITDADAAREFAPGLATPLALSAAGAMQFTLATAAPIDIGDFYNLWNLTIADLGAVTTSVPAVFALSADVNGNGLDDVLKVDASSIEFAIDAIDFSDLLFSGGGSGPITATGSLGITAANVILHADVVDALSDPPFVMSLSGSVGTSAVPLPPALLLMTPALAGLAWSRRETHRVSR